ELRSNAAPGVANPSITLQTFRADIAMSRFVARGLWFGVLMLAGVVAAGDSTAEELTVYRDDFGTPHIYATTAEGACFGHGYAQATDRLEELLRQYLRATGTMSEAFGPDFLRDDYRQRVWQHAAIAREKYPQLSGKVRGLIEAYQAGVKQY